MSHGIHDLPRIVLGDDCDECVHRSMEFERLGHLDNFNLRALGDIAAVKKETGEWPDNASNADKRAVENLRAAARLVFATGITERAAQ